MNPSEATTLIASLKAAYPRQEIGEDTLAVYVGDLLDLDATLAREAVALVRRTSKWFPTIAEIRDAVARLEVGAPSASIAFGQVLARVSHRPDWIACPACGGHFVEDGCGVCRDEGRVDGAKLPPLHPLVAEARALVGDWRDWREQPTTMLQRSFMQAYAEVHREAMLAISAPRDEPQALASGAAAPLPELKAIAS